MGSSFAFCLQFGDELSKAKEAYHRFVIDGVGKTLWLDLRQQGFLGCDNFVQEHIWKRSFKEKSGGIREVPVKQGGPNALSLNEYESRYQAIITVFKSGAYTQKEIGEYFGLHYSRISRIMEKCKI